MQTFKKNKEYIFEIIHDIKAPIMSMDYALKTIPKNEILEEIYKINKHNLNYIENLLTTHLIEKGKYCPKFELINLIQITEEELRVLNFLITEKKLRINLIYFLLLVLHVLILLMVKLLILRVFLH